MTRWKKRLLCAAAAALCASAAAGCAGNSRPVRAAAPTISNSGEVVAAIRTGLRDYASAITIRFDCGADILDDLPALTDGWIEAALEETENPVEGDYIRYQYGGYESACRYELKNGRYAYTVEIIPKYYLYSVQERETSAKLETVCAGLALNGRMSDYEKLRAIYGYVCGNVSYDKVHRKNEFHHEKSTAYAALVKGTATCQGYSVLLYRMLRENGIDCRVVTGTAADETGEQLHAWNIALLDGQYYYLDATWDAGSEEYRWFLRGSGSFENHTPGEEFTAGAFAQRYPIAVRDYCPRET